MKGDGLRCKRKVWQYVHKTVNFTSAKRVLTRELELMMYEASGAPGRNV